MAEKRQKKQAVKAFEKETFSKDKEVTGVKHIEHRQDNTFSVENQFSASEKPVSNLPQDANHGSRTGNATSGHNVQKWKGTKMSKKNGKKLLIAVAVGAVVVKAVRDVIKAKKQEEELRSALDDFYEEELNWWEREHEEGEKL